MSKIFSLDSSDITTQPFIDYRIAKKVSVIKNIVLVLLVLIH